MKSRTLTRSSLVALAVTMALRLGLGQAQALSSVEKSARPHPQAFKNLNLLDLQQAIVKRILWVDEFQQIQQLAKEAGLQKVYLFGGAAAAFAHYVRWDLERERGSKWHPERRFDYRYESIFRITQDLDIVVDAHSIGSLKAFQQAVRGLARFQVDRSVSEVLSLRTNTSWRRALLNDKDFLTQHSDSHSTGLIEIPLQPFVDDHGLAAAPMSRALFKDVRHWDAHTPPFIQDIFLQQLTCYYDPLKHQKTVRFQNGQNPEIFFAVRALTKMLQYNLSLSAGCEEILRKIFANFQPAQDLKTPYSYKWMKKNAKKLYQNAMDLERAYVILNDLGALKALKKIMPHYKKTDSLSWWLQQKPLQGFDVRGVEAIETPVTHKTKGADERVLASPDQIQEANAATPLTAKDIDVQFVQSLVPSYLFYEMIEKAFFTNVFENVEGGFQVNPIHLDVVGAKSNSRHSTRGLPKNSSLQALGGQGWDKQGKTKIDLNRQGSPRVNLVFRVHPEARLGVDFKIENKKITILNKYVLQLLPESLNLDPLVYFQHLSDRASVFVDSTKEVRSRIYDQLNKTLSQNANQKQSLAQLVFRSLKKSKHAKAVLEQWLALDVSAEYGELVQNILDSALASSSATQLSHSNLSDSRPSNSNPSGVRLSSANISSSSSSRSNLSNTNLLASSLSNSSPVDASLLTGSIVQALAYPHWARSPWATEWIEDFITRGLYYRELAQQVLNKKPWVKHPRVTSWLRAIGLQIGWASVVKILSHPAWGQQPQSANLVDEILTHPQYDIVVAQKLLGQRHWGTHDKALQWLETIVWRGQADWQVIVHVLNQPWWVHNINDGAVLIDLILQNKKHDWALPQYILSQQAWAQHPKATQWLHTLQRQGHTQKIKKHLNCADLLLSEGSLLAEGA